MKKLLQFVSLTLSLFWVVSGCTKLFDVPPRAIYSPIELGAATVTKGSDTVRTTFVTASSGGGTLESLLDVTRLDIAVRDTALRYGAIVFYDSLGAANLIKTGQIIGVPSTYQEDSLSRTRRTRTRRISVRIDPLKGQFQYIVPVAYSKDSTRTYTAQGFIRTKISPWTHLADLDFYVTQTYAIRIFQGNGKLGYVLYDKNYSLSPQIIFFEFNPANATWTRKAAFSAIMCHTCSSVPGSNNRSYVQNIEMGYFSGGQYHFLVNSIEVPGGLRAYRTGQLSTDANFNFVSHANLSANSSQTINYYATDWQRDTLRVLQRTVNFTTRPNPNNPYDFTIPNAWFRRGAESVTQYPTTEPLSSPTFAAFIGQKLIANAQGQHNEFRVYDLSNGQFRRAGTYTATNPNVLWTQSAQNFERYITISEANSAYLLNNNLNLYRVTINADNSPNFQNFYANWFPGNSANAITQGILYQGKLVFLVNDYQLWEFDPNQLSINFNRPGAVTIVPL